jgi:hypothetical protein
VWVEEEVEVDEHGNPIEGTARIVTVGDGGADGAVPAMGSVGF